MKLKIRDAIFFMLLVLVAFKVDYCSGSKDGLIKMRSASLGGLRARNSAETDSIGRFAVQEHNKNQNAALDFVRVIQAKEQVVAGKMYHLTLEVVDAGKKKIYEAKVWVKPWMNFKRLQEFKQAHDIPKLA